MHRKAPTIRHHVLLILVFSLAQIGCGGNSLETLVVHGTVTFGGDKAEMGRIRFIPIDDTAGPASHGAIVNGSYRIDARGGVPLGRHRVQIEVYRLAPEKKQVQDFDAIEQLGPPEYRHESSPLSVEITKESDGKFDFEIPRL